MGHSQYDTRRSRPHAEWLKRIVRLAAASARSAGNLKRCVPASVYERELASLLTELAGIDLPELVSTEVRVHARRYIHVPASGANTDPSPAENAQTRHVAAKSRRDDACTERSRHSMPNHHNNPFYGSVR